MPRNYDKNRDDEYKAAYDKGLSCVEMGKAIGVSTSAAAQWLRKHDLPPHGSPNGAGNIPVAQRPVLTDDIEVRPIPSLPGYSVSVDGLVPAKATVPSAGGSASSIAPPIVSGAVKRQGESRSSSAMQAALDLTIHRRR